LPIYEYECADCSCQFELKKSFNEDTHVPCPQCGGSTHRIFSPAAIIFKGSGFYCTDSRKGSSLPSGNDGKDKTTGGKPESKVDTPEHRKDGDG